MATKRKTKKKKGETVCASTSDGRCVSLATWQFGVAWGVAISSGMLFLGLLGALFGYGVDMVNMIGTVYWGYEPTLPGAVIGGAYGFVDGFIGGVIIAAVYNWLWRP
jgi:hypothetical protein